VVKTDIDTETDATNKPEIEPEEDQHGVQGIDEDDDDEELEEDQGQEEDQEEKLDNTSSPTTTTSSSAKRRRFNQQKSELGTSFTEILGTPIVNNAKEINKVPDWDKFSENICEHKPYEMNSQTPSGSYVKIVKLTKDFKTSLNNSINGGTS
jgi:hypothetical protein